MSLLDVSENGGALVSINPKRSVEFNLQQIIDGERHCSALLVVKNVSTRPIAFKVKTTHLGWYFVKPNQDVLKEGESKEVVITLTDVESKRILEAASRGVFESLDRHRFRVQAKPISAADYELISCVPIHLKGEKSAHIWGNDTTMSRSDKRLRVELTYPSFLTSAPGSPDSLDNNGAAAGLSSSMGWRGDANTTAGAADLTAFPDGRPSPGQQGQGGERGVRFAPSSSPSPDVQPEGQRKRAVTANLSPNSSLGPAQGHSQSQSLNQSHNQSASSPSVSNLSAAPSLLGQGQAHPSSSSSSSSSPRTAGFPSSSQPSTATTSPESSAGDPEPDVFFMPEAPFHDTAPMAGPMAGPAGEGEGEGEGEGQGLIGNLGMGLGMGLEAASLPLQRQVNELRQREREREREREQVPLWARSPPGKSSLSTPSASASASASRSYSTNAVKPNVLLLCSGSVAAVKVPELVSALCAFTNVRIVLSSQAARHFLSCAKDYNPVAWAAFEAAGGDRLVVSEEQEWAWSKLGDPVVHIALRKWAHVAVLAPASADALAKVSAGICDSLLLSVLRAWDFKKPVIAAPAMNTLMWTHPATKVTLLQLRLWGFRVLEPQEKMLACREEGRGALAAVGDIIEAVRDALDSYDWTAAWAVKGSPASASASGAGAEEEEDGSSGLAFLKPTFLSPSSSVLAVPAPAPASSSASTSTSAPAPSKQGGSGISGSPPSSPSAASTAAMTVAVAGGASLLALASLLLLTPHSAARAVGSDPLKPGQSPAETAAAAASALKAVAWSAWNGALAASARWPRDALAVAGTALAQTSSALGLK